MNKDDVLKEINERYFAARVGGRLRFFEDRFPLEGMDKQAFQFEMEPYKISTEKSDSGGVKIEPAYKVWSAWAGRRHYKDGFILDPNTDGHTDRAYNLWRGYGVDEVEGDIKPFL